MKSRVKRKSVLSGGFSKSSPFLVCALIIGILFQDTSYAYWAQGYNGSSEVNLGSIRIGHRPDPSSGLLPDTPSEVVEAIEGMSPQAQEAVVSVVNDLVADPHFNGDLIVAEEPADLFDNGPLNIDSGDVVVYTTTNDDGSKSSIVVTVVEGYPQDINTIDDFNRKLNEPWSGVNILVPYWVATNRYTQFTAPVEYNGKLYLPLQVGATGTTPDNKNAWFELPEGLLYNPLNIYPFNSGGYVVEYGADAVGEPRYYISKQYVSPNVIPTTTWAWTPIPHATSGAGYASGAVVWTDDGQGPRFWRALTATGSMPSVQGAEQGIWQEFVNGWFATGALSSHYFGHNTYAAGETVIYGTSVTLHYRYYRAVRDVSAYQAPLIDDGTGKMILNTSYWAEVK